MTKDKRQKIKDKRQKNHKTHSSHQILMIKGTQLNPCRAGSRSTSLKKCSNTETNLLFPDDTLFHVVDEPDEVIAVPNSTAV